MNFELHTRHIPREHLREDSVMGRMVIDNGMCDILQPDILKQLKDCGVSCIETRLTWHELEVSPGRYDWSRFDRDAEKILAGGITLGVFPWFHHPPAWENSLVRLSSLEQKKDGIPSLWDQRLLEVYDRLYGKLREHCGNDIGYLGCCDYGDYGEILFPIGIKHYKSLPPGLTIGHWSNDPLARKSFAGFLRKRYHEDLSLLNSAWETSFGSWEEDMMIRLPFHSNSLKRRIDFGTWYVGSLENFADHALGIARRHFPDVPAGVPIGATFEGLTSGQIKSRSARLAAKYHMDARWCALARFQDDVRKSLVLSRRLSAAARFYGTTYASESALGTPYHLQGLFELEADAGRVLQVDPYDLLKAKETYLREKPFIRPDRKVRTAPAAVFYPVEGELYQCLNGDCDEAPPLQDASEGQAFRFREPIEDVFDRFMKVAKSFDFDFTDSTLIADGMLENYNMLLFPASMPVPENCAEQIGAWAKRGGRILIGADCHVRILETGKSLPTYAAERGFPVELAATFPAFAEYEKLHAEFGPDAVITLFDDGGIAYLPASGEIKHW